MKRNLILIVLISVSYLSFIGCKSEKKSSSANAGPQSYTTLYDKPLSEIKELINGQWALVHGVNDRESSDYENTFITFDGDNYVWTEDGEKEPGRLNWRKAPSGDGYDAYLMDVFYEEYPSYPLAISGDSLFIKDISDTKYLYTLLRKR